MMRKALTAIVALAIVITGAIIGLRFAGDDPVKGKAASQVTASNHAEEDHYRRKVEQGETALAQEERKLAEGRRHVCGRHNGYERERSEQGADAWGRHNGEQGRNAGVAQLRGRRICEVGLMGRHTRATG